MKYPKKDIDLTPLLMEKLGQKRRKIGRYNCSDLYAIKAGWLTPEKFLDGETVDFLGLMRMLSGIIIHEKIQMLLKEELCEVKVEYPYEDIILVGKADYLPPIIGGEPSEVWDFKTSEKIMKTAKPWGLHQVRLYTTMFERDFGVIYQPVIENERMIIKDRGRIERDDHWFAGEMEMLMDFDRKVKNLADKRGVDYKTIRDKNEAGR